MRTQRLIRIHRLRVAVAAAAATVFMAVWGAVAVLAPASAGKAKPAHTPSAAAAPAGSTASTDGSQQQSFDDGTSSTSLPPVQTAQS